MFYRILKWPLLIAVVGLIALFISYVLPYLSPLKRVENPVIVNDVTQLNPIRVAEVFAPTFEQDLVAKIKSTSGPISVGGGRYSQGGQTALEQSLHLDMRSYNKVVYFDASERLITVQAGMRWRDLQAFTDKHDLAISIMQSYADFTVGGSLSVNAHGRYIGEGPIIKSVVSIKLVLANGDVVEASPQQSAELFYAAIGGYGGVGIIAEATLRLAENSKVERTTNAMALSDYPGYFQAEIANNPQVIFHNGILYPPHYQDLTAVSWLKTDKTVTVVERIHSSDKHYWWQPALTDFVADYPFAKSFRQHLLDPIMLNRPAVHWRNYEASYDVKELEPHSREYYTYGLREYFVPTANLLAFAGDMANILQRHDVNVLNVSIRHAHPDPGSVLAWAPQEVFAFVIYYRQATDTKSQQQVDIWSRQLVDAAIKHGGTYYLPYQLNATAAQFCKAYPRSSEFFSLKQRYDPQLRFSSKFWQKYLHAMQNCAEAQ